ncbi:MAG TPA: ABC transporter permease [Vicinamibacterales bacterium]|nr:ABC transporter permease [Vicinamibacterales bacterium]
MQDLRYAIRTLLRSRGFTVVAVLTLALGIGATTAIFSVVHGVLMKPLPYRDPERLANIWVDLGVGNQSLPAVTPLDFLDYQQRGTLFESFAAASGGQVVGVTGALTGSSGLETERVDVTPVTANFFSLFGVDPMLGRHFRPDEATPGSPQVAILSHRLWKRRYGADPGIVGRQIRLDGIDHTVVGVMPQGFALLLPAEAFLVTDAQIWKPLRYNYQNAPPRNFTIFTVFARLKAGVTFAQAQGEMDTLARQLRQEHPIHESSDMRIRVVPLQADIVKHAEPALLALLGAVVFVLLIACANVAHLLLARSTARQHEMALRAALGARGSRLVRQLATESLVLAATGGALGIVCAQAGLDVLRRLAPANLPRLDAIGVDATVLLFALGISAVTALLFGLVPALRAAKQDLNRTLRASTSLSPTRAQLKLRNALVIAEIALALVLLVGAGLLMRSFVRLQQVSPGFDASRTLTFRVALPFGNRGRLDLRVAYLQELERRLRTIAGVTHVGFTSQLPLTGSGPLQPYAYNEETARNWESETSDRRSVSTDYFHAMGTRLLAGRFFDEHDRVVRNGILIDDTLAAKVWRGQPAVGKQLQIQPNGTPGGINAEVIGVVEHMRILDVAQAVRPQIWVPMLSGVPGTFYAVVRTDADPASLAPDVRQAVRAVDPDVAIDRVLPMAAYVADGLAQARLSLALMTAFGAAALLLAVVGVYGVIAYSVSERTREIGIRMALGERPSSVRNAILVQGLKLIVPSLALGTAAAWVLSTFISNLLYETDAADPLIFGATATLLLAVALAGCYIPARRATSVSPIAAIRAE